ncbi:hypothetical protein MLD38_012739 [Melastoma candidum]|uniref:Uncharacterized protein n=1 Tax=Melastoma candidum TaxID=119954 RepID=A0ACB9R6X8_9MYRT|nr:hypothetical protein MLD38_012739 [Melastoma candidum]
MSCCGCFRASSAAAGFPPPPIISSGNRRVSSLLSSRPTAFAPPSSTPLLTRAFLGHCTVLLEVSSDVVATARPPDPSILLQASLLLLSLYVVTNFVVPSYVTKYLLNKDGDEDSNPPDEDKRSDR